MKHASAYRAGVLALIAALSCFWFAGRVLSAEKPVPAPLKLGEGKPPEPPPEVFPPALPKLGEGKPPEPPPEADAPTPVDLPREIVLREFLVIGSVGKYGRTPLHVDVIDAMLASGTWQPPQADQALTAPSGEVRKWEPARAAADGWLDNASLRGGYAYAQINSPVQRVMLLEPRGAAVALVNGVPRAGDVYNTGEHLLPVMLKQGANHFLFHVGGGRLAARLLEPKTEVAFSSHDHTLPDLIVGQSGPYWGAVPVINASTETLEDLTVTASRGSQAATSTEAGTIPPLSVRKVAFRIDGAPSAASGDEIQLKLLAKQKDKQHTLDDTTITLTVRKATDSHRRTFISNIDGSVQQYAMRPALPRPAGEPAPGIILSLHGAGIDALRQANQYDAKPWAHVVAPTNRRPYGFDWEDWGRIDALEALADVQQRDPIDSRRVYLTGHAMGGHGVWHLGATYPDHFAAIGPSGGWFSFWSYGGMPKSENPTEIDKLLLRGMNGSDTLKLVHNLDPLGVYVLHGQEDQQVPVSQARFMRGQLAKFHTNFAYYEKPGAEHWWGSPCCDWPPMMQFFQRQTIPDVEDVRQIDFVTANPGISSSAHWLTIEAQQTQLEPSRVTIELDPAENRFTGTTKNVARLALELSHLDRAKLLHLDLDGHKIGQIRWPSSGTKMWLTRVGDRWNVVGRRPAAQKGPHRYGTLKDVFRNRVVFVYGTRGTKEENAWSLAKARFDAETFYYRGNGSVEVVSDKQFDPDADKDRNVVIYGNADSNGAWPPLLSTSPIQIRRDRVRIGTRPESGDDVACLMIRPRPGSDIASVAVITGTGLRGMRATNRLRYFVSGVAYPDLMLLRSDVLEQGNAGIRMIGYFGPDWSIEKGEFLWRDLAL